MGRRGFSLIEVLVVVAILALLTALLVPSLSRVRDQARLANCLRQLRTVHIGLLEYAQAHRNAMPPFAFTDHLGTDLPLSAHWGGASQPGDPAGKIRRGVRCVGLWAVVREGMLPPGALVCPASGCGTGASDPSLFPYTRQFSTYALRTPYSRDLLRGSDDSVPLIRRYRLVYGPQSGGQRIAAIGGGSGAWVAGIAPLARVDRFYESATARTASGRPHRIDMGTGAWLVDGFWLPETDRDAPPGGANLEGYPQHAGRAHESTFNVLYGSGEARSRQDDGTIAGQALGSPAAQSSAAEAFAPCSERVWQFLDGR